MDVSMERRMFVRVVGGAALTSTVPFDYVQGTEESAFDTSGILVEAASFAERGGWKLDTQHYLQMGGCYLLAHGMGRPVGDARTKVRIPRSGTWHVWVRTRNWCPGDWQAPGRFKVQLNGALLKPEFGDEGKAWHWQKGGTVDIGW